MSKKNLMFMSACALLMAACSDKDAPDNINGGNLSDGNAKYITVAISGLPDAPTGTRAGEVFDNQDPDGNASYEYGSEEENKVNKVRFYFFNDNGDAASVKLSSDGSYINYFDWTADADPNINDSEGDNAPNVEKIIKATLVINTEAGDKLPTRIAAVVNPTDQIGDEVRSLASLRQVVGDYKSSLSTYGFTMSTSVYLGHNNAEVTSTAIPEESIQDTPQGALLQPVVVYVERVVGKVRVKVDETAFAGRLKTINGATAIALVDADGAPIMAEGKQVYARFTNWNLTGTNVKSYLNKHINTSWLNIAEFQQWTWNHPSFFRSFWAYNCPGNVRSYFSYNELIGSTGAKFGTESTSLYCSENGATVNTIESGAGDQYPTCGIMGAVLCYEDGTPVEFYKFLGQTLVGEDNLLAAMLSSIQGRHQLYSLEVVNGQNVFSEIKAEDIELETAYAAGKADLSNATKGRYHSYITLSEKGRNKKWYSAINPSQDPTTGFLRETEVNNFLQQTTGAVSLWNDGMTYYYFPIEHLGKLGEDGTNYGKYGVIRNHIYDSTITKLYGLGTPVYNPNETIYPEKPEDDDSYIAAQINILSWRLVNNNVELEWPN